MSDRFRTIAIALRDHIGDTYSLLAAADAVMAKDHTISVERPVITTPDGEATYNWDNGRWTWNHDALVNKALHLYGVMDNLDLGKKINAIKALREETKCGLKEAKDAVEDDRVQAMVRPRMADPWESHEEVPF